jgi:subtilisin family serine protease
MTNILSQVVTSRISKSILFAFIIAVLLLVTVISSISFAYPDNGWEQKVEPEVLSQLSTAERAEYLVLLQEQADLGSASTLDRKEEKGQFVFQALRDVSTRTQTPLIALLEATGSTYQSFWIANMLLVESDQNTMIALAERPDVARILSNPRIEITLPEPSLQPYSLVEIIPWNIETIQAENLWDSGITGEGVVVGGQDTGYEWHHPALIDQYRGWNGVTADHNYNWHDAIHSGGSPGCEPDSQEPCDDHSHGTHTMGTVVGDGGLDYHIGVAPGARWIGCRNMDRGAGTPATYAECYQWFLAPTELNGQNPDPFLAPDIINNSWSCPESEDCPRTNPEILKVFVENVRSAGILSVHSAGNDGSNCSTVNTPSAIYDASFTVGAVNQSGDIASFSSRGPVLVDDSGRLKPDISAPGVHIFSSVPGGLYGYKSGTSMAAPHVAGLAALIISAYPSLKGNPDQIENAIIQMAEPHISGQDCGDVPGSQIPNNTYGHGVISAGHPWLAIEASASDRFNNTADPIELSLEISHSPILSQTHGIVITTTNPSGSTFISATAPYTLSNNAVSWSIDVLEKDQSVTLQLSVIADEQLGELVFGDFEGTSWEIDQAIVIGPEKIALPRGYYYPLFRED